MAEGFGVEGKGSIGHQGVRGFGGVGLNFWVPYFKISVPLALRFRRSQ